MYLHLIILADPPSRNEPHGDCEDDVVICCAVRTPLCKAKRGSFKEL